MERTVLWKLDDASALSVVVVALFAARRVGSRGRH